MLGTQRNFNNAVSRNSPARRRAFHPDEQRAFEALAEHQSRPDVGTWLRDLARVYVRRYLRERPPGAKAKA